MQSLLDLHGAAPLAAAFAVMALAGLVKGAVGFALPMVAISGIGSVLPAPLAIAAVILPSLVTNVWQSLRQGLGEARASFRGYWRYHVTMAAVIWVVAGLVVLVPDRALFLLLGAMVTAASLVQLAGWVPPDPGRDPRMEIGAGAVSGLFGGLAAVWGPPLVLYLLARKVAKTEMVRVQGIAYLIGSVVLTAAHGRSGLLDADAAAFSALLVLPAVAGMALGLRLQDRLPQAPFRRATMAVLVLAGLNLLRRGLAG